MKDFLKKYPGLIVFIGIAILLTVAFGVYMIVYNGKNNRQQDAYDELKKNAWLTDLDGGESDTVDEDAAFRALNEAKMKAFLEEVENADYYRTQLKSRPDFGAYRKINEDVIGYLLVPNTNIDYPILQSEISRDYYLKRNIDGSTGYPGCIYIEIINSPDFKDSVTIAYGHNMSNGTMFGQLHKLHRDKEFLKANRYFFVYQPDSVSVYEIIACTAYSDAHLLSGNYKREGSNYMFTGIKPDDQITVMKNLKEYGDKNAYFAEDSELTEEDKCFVMSTCNGGKSRIITVGKLLFTHMY